MTRISYRPISGSLEQVLRFVLLGLGSAIVYAAALLRFPLVGIYNYPLQNLDKLTLSDRATGIVLGGSVLLLFASYATGALLLDRAVELGPHGGRRLAPVVLGFPVLFIVLLLLVYPTTSVDLYDYLFRGRMLARYNANTFLLVPRDFRTDPLFPYVAWKGAVTAYGPVWEGMSWLVARLAGEASGAGGTNATRDAELLRLLLAYKGLAVLGFGLCSVAIWAALGRLAPERRWFGLYLWLWNPLVLWESIAAGHNDAWMALLIVLAVWALGGQRGANARQGTSRPGSPAPVRPRGRALLALLALTAGGLIKYLTLVLVPVLLGAALGQLRTWRERRRLVLVGGLVCTVVVVLAYAPFWAGWETLRNFSDRRALFTASWLAALQLWLLDRGVARELAQAIAAAIGLGLLCFGVIWATWRAWSAPRAVAAHALWLLLWFLFVCNPWFQPWYLLWALALVALQPWRIRLLWGVGLFCCTAMLSYVAGSFLRPALSWDAESAGWNALVSVLIYGPPLLALGWSYRARGALVGQRLQGIVRALASGGKRDAVARQR